MAQRHHRRAATPAPGVAWPGRRSPCAVRARRRRAESPGSWRSHRRGALRAVRLRGAGRRAPCCARATSNRRDTRHEGQERDEIDEGGERQTRGATDEVPPLSSKTQHHPHKHRTYASTSDLLQTELLVSRESIYLILSIEKTQFSRLPYFDRSSAHLYVNFRCAMLPQWT